MSINFGVNFFIYLLLVNIGANQTKTMNFILIMGLCNFLSKNFRLSEGS